MRKYYFLCMLMCFFVLMQADSIDNQLINDLQTSKVESKKQDSKQENIESTQKSAQDSKKSNKKIKKVSKTQIEEVILESPNNGEIITQDSKGNIESNSTEQKDLKKQIEILEAKLDSKKRQKQLKWFIGAHIGTRYNLQYSGVNASNFELALHGGLFYNVASNHGLRAFLNVSYFTLNKAQTFFIGGGLDYFYSFSGGFKIFGGFSTNIPLNNNVTKSIDVFIYAGVGGFLAKNHHIDLKIGYPLMQDSAFNKAVNIGIGYQYIFDK